ncbi:MAG: hypothetical protein EXS47_02035 [Candidatus Zambryskibacteria bacterium]|nr:hypothetical protein [Candidatus Zambryskibacteria bacterium]
MSTWARRRKTVYLGGLIVCVAVFIGIPLFTTFYVAPTCFDGKLNQREYGIDCGGPCVKLCSSQFLNPIVVWARAIPVTKGVYNLLAYVQNPNLSGEVKHAYYTFKLFDRAGIVIDERKGNTFILPHSNSPVFEGGIVSGERIPALVTFEFVEPLAWEKIDYIDPAIVVTSKTLSFAIEDGSPRIDATIQNRSTATLGVIEVTAIVYDTSDNAMAFSKTLIDGLGDNQSQGVTFTWPKTFPKKSSRIEIIPLVRP